MKKKYNNINAVVLSVIGIVMSVFFGYLMHKKTGQPSDSGYNEAAGGGYSENVSRMENTVKPIRKTQTTTPAPMPLPTVKPTPKFTLSPTQKMTLPPTLSPTATPAMTQRQNNSSYNDISPIYDEFTDAVYGISCIIPSHFDVTYSYPDSLYAVQANDGTAVEIINVKGADCSLEDDYKKYVREIGGEYTVNHSNNFYTVKIIKDNMIYYKFCVLKNNNFYWFEFISKSEQWGKYSKYVRDIEESFRINK